MKNYTLTLLLGILAVAISGFRAEVIESSKIERALTNKDWAFYRAESLNGDISHVINTLYNNSSFYFSSTKQYEEKFFEKNVDGEWYVEGNKLFLNKGKFDEEVLDVIEITDKTLKLSVIERGEVVTLTYR
ncbi:hypothetical protein [Chryseosolibacter indicus]|uniref:Lipocalin-like domain-containing protein n=1 Tax=Chryseosolibacter indicus TaxID=2782351 RepID=A0ABS5VLB1_9BACT|nr:hypothetical protein [Chryseosolibacter indicus]MBT1702238.1 hypothetical protein [Chryseosolibacter indicus]